MAGVLAFGGVGDGGDPLQAEVVVEPQRQLRFPPFPIKFDTASETLDGSSAVEITTTDFHLDISELIRESQLYERAKADVSTADRFWTTADE